MSYRTLDAIHIVDTLRALERRIVERFPGSSLASVCRELVAIGEQAYQRSRSIAAPHLSLRAALFLAIAAAVAGLTLVVLSVKVQVGTADIFGVFQGVEAAANIVVLAGAALFFLVSLETRIKRRRSLRDLHVFRSIAHVIDMHQLTKDPSLVLGGEHDTAASPKRKMTAFELGRYLDYSSEMLSLAGKVAALYAQDLDAPVVVEAVNDIEMLATNLSRKIWQKIAILQSAVHEQMLAKVLTE
jgi:hypothetical protein